MRRQTLAAEPTQPLHHSPPLSKGGFAGMTGRVVLAGSTVSPALREERALQRDHRAAELADRDIVKLAGVRMEGWEREKEVRVRNAFERIVEHGWYDKSEVSLKAIELGHINAVREHYAMRRDKIKTPALFPTSVAAPLSRAMRLDPESQPGPATTGTKQNTWNALEWADNVNAVDELSKPTNVQQHFAYLIEVQSAKRKKKQQQQQQRQ